MDRTRRGCGPSLCTRDRAARDDHASCTPFPGPPRCPSGGDVPAWLLRTRGPCYDRPRPIDRTRRCEGLSIGTVEIALIAALVLVLFGPTRMAEMLRSFGKVTREVRKAVADVRRELEEASRVDDKDDSQTRR